MSGTGDATAVTFDSSTSSAGMGIMNCSDRRNFLNDKPSAVRYLWAKAEEHNLSHTICKQLNDNAAFDSASGAAVLTVLNRTG